MSRRETSQGLLGVFDHYDGMIEAIKNAQESDVEICDVFLPAGDHHVLDMIYKKRSPVRFLTFAGAITGLISGFALAILTSLVWNLVVGGKPVTNPIPFVVVGFELTILFGALATLVAVLIFGGLPFRKFPGKAYRPEFSLDTFGVWLSCTEGNRDMAREILKSADAKEIHDISDPASPEVQS